MTSIRWIDTGEKNFQIATVPGYTLKVYIPVGGIEWDFELFTADGDLISYGSEYTRKDAKRAVERLLEDLMVTAQ